MRKILSDLGYLARTYRNRCERAGGLLVVTNGPPEVCTRFERVTFTELKNRMSWDWPRSPPNGMAYSREHRAGFHLEP